MLAESVMRLPKFWRSWVLIPAPRQWTKRRLKEWELLVPCLAEYEIILKPHRVTVDVALKYNEMPGQRSIEQKDFAICDTSKRIGDYYCIIDYNYYNTQFIPVFKFEEDMGFG